MSYIIIALMIFTIPFSLAGMEISIHDAARSGRTDRIEALLAAGATVDQLNDAQQTPLLLAILHDRVDAVRYLLFRGAQVNGLSACNHPLYAALKCRKSAAIITYLLDYEADTGKKYYKLLGETPLHTAASAVLDTMISYAKQNDLTDSPCYATQGSKPIVLLNPTLKAKTIEAIVSIARDPAKIKDSPRIRQLETMQLLIERGLTLYNNTSSTQPNGVYRQA